MTETIDSSVLTRRIGSPGRMTRGRSSARGTARNDVYGVTNLYLPRQTNDFVDRGLIFAIAFDLLEQCVDAGTRPQPRQLWMIRGFSRQARLARHLYRSPIAHAMNGESRRSPAASDTARPTTRGSPKKSPPAAGKPYRTAIIWIDREIQLPNRAAANLRQETNSA